MSGSMVFEVIAIGCCRSISFRYCARFLRDRDEFERIGREGMIELGGTAVIAGRLILSAAVEHDFIAGKPVEQFVFAEFAPFASCRILKLPVVVAEPLEDQEPSRPDLDMMPCLSAFSDIRFPRTVVARALEGEKAKSGGQPA